MIETRPARDTAKNEAPQFAWDAESATVECVSISVLLPADSPRLTGEDAEHVRLLAATDGQLPPITVHRQTMRVIDGMHRLQAAVTRGHETINVRFFDGSDEDAFVLAVQLNVGHGLPLTRADRTAAARRIISLHSTWSDRLIASVSGLSAGTIRALRKECGEPKAVAARVGRDGRVRPTDAAAGRLAASRVVTEQPDASLREIARRAGVSLGTARDVRERMQHGEDPLPPMQRTNRRLAAAQAEGLHEPGATADHQHECTAGAAGDPACSGQHVTILTGARNTSPRLAGNSRFPGFEADEQIPEVPELLNSLIRDPSLRFTDNGRKLLRWLSTVSSTLPTWNQVAPTVPSHSAYMVADLARKCAAEWSSFANEVAKMTDVAM
ncbi:ParB N-terminal domain-containing protein [Winogradskya humida]